MFINKRFVMNDYQNRPPFCSFLPAIAGEYGVPVWNYYVNRGQAVCSFGTEDKNHCIMEFSPAHAAYRDTARRGFRTFIKINDNVYEAFKGGKTSMHIGTNDLIIFWENSDISVRVTYFVLPDTAVGALARKTEVTYNGECEAEIELLDGMAEIVPSGVSLDNLKNMLNTAKAWMQAEDFGSGRTLFRIRASIEDTADVAEINECTFCISFDEKGKRLATLTMPEIIFGSDTALEYPDNFQKNNIERLLSCYQPAQNILPCCFIGKKSVLKKGETAVICSLYGQADNIADADMLAAEASDISWFDKKHAEAVVLGADITEAAAVHTADPVFDAYCRQTYLDNALRGGIPKIIGGKPVYIYSRKHGDPERDYNFFRISREYFSQGNGNYRDVCQNRRNDIRFEPQIGTANIKSFINLIQTDGYNPLVIESTSYITSDTDELIAMIAPENREQAARLLSDEFTAGGLARAAEGWKFLDGHTDRELLAAAIAGAEPIEHYSFGEGYWCDHWTYNLDLIESYLDIYPENTDYLLSEDVSYMWAARTMEINPRKERFTVTSKGVRQYNFLRKNNSEKESWEKDRSGRIMRSCLAEKLILLCLLKYTALDPHGTGIETEGGKPGWYDALNGLPALFGSSVSESCELVRLADFLLKKLSSDVYVYTETAALMNSIAAVRSTYGTSLWYEKLNAIKENYRHETEEGFSGEKQLLGINEICRCLRMIRDNVMSAIKSAVHENGNIPPAYFMYEYSADGSSCEKRSMPCFLESVVHWLRLDIPEDIKRSVIAGVRESGLYDKKLKMYKVNDCLDQLSQEIGRARAFTAGWLENESVFLHMEYKYLLELLRNGFYEEFGKAFRDAAVPFLDPDVYGRSTIENVSFIVSSANKNERLHGRGFAPRLSGAAAEMLEIQQIMFVGRHPFTVTDGELSFCPCPYLPEYLIGNERELRTALFGKTELVYILDDELNELIPRKYNIGNIELIRNNSAPDTAYGYICGAAAEKIRNGYYDRIVVHIGK